ncbi:MAG: hypothetical protein QMB65_01490, partial [Vicingaceae bacterium]
MKQFLSVLGIILFAFTGLSQNNYGIKNPEESSIAQKCGECLSVMQNLPPEVSFGFYLEGRKIYFMMTDKRYFDLLFKKGMDGIAVDIVTKSQFPCNEENQLANSPINMGKLLEPVYFKDFKKELLIGENGQIGVFVGQLPEIYSSQDYELNLLILKNGNMCYYQIFSDLPRARWGLLEMGLYRDSIMNNESLSGGESTINSTERVKRLNKTMKFVIPFEKGKSEYAPEDIKPLYDSLQLTD